METFLLLFLFPKVHFPISSAKLRIADVVKVTSPHGMHTILLACTSFIETTQELVYSPGNFNSCSNTLRCTLSSTLVHSWAEPQKQ